MGIQQTTIRDTSGLPTDEGLLKEMERICGALRPRPCLAEQALLLTDLHYLTHEHFSSAGEVRANKANRAMGNDVADNLSPTFVEYAAANGKLPLKSVQRGIRRGKLISRMLLERVRDELPSHGQGALLDRLTAEKTTDHKRLIDDAVLAAVQPKAGPSPSPIFDAFVAAYERVKNDEVRARDALHVAKFLKEQFPLSNRQLQMIAGDSQGVLEKCISEGRLFDCIGTDPPYGIGYTDAQRRKIANDEAPPLWCVELMARALKPDGVLCLFTCQSVLPQWRAAMEEAGLTIREVIEWDKVNTWFDQRAKEVLLVGDKGTARNFTDDFDKSWSCPTPRNKDIRANHPTPKPLELMERLVRKYSRPGELVCDPFMGGGPMGVAASKLGRHFVGIELDPTYLLRSASRLMASVEIQHLLKDLPGNQTVA